METIKVRFLFKQSQETHFMNNLKKINPQISKLIPKFVNMFPSIVGFLEYSIASGCGVS